MSNEVSALMKRYKDAYLIARVTNGWGKLIKIFGIAMAILLIIIGLMFIGDRGLGNISFAMGVVTIVSGLIVGVLFYIVGIIVSAQGQILKASLDSAVNNSPFLTNEQRARIMSLTQEDSAGKSFDPPKDRRSHKKVSNQLEGYLAELEKGKKSYRGE